MRVIIKLLARLHPLKEGDPFSFTINFVKSAGAFTILLSNFNLFFLFVNHGNAKSLPNFYSIVQILAVLRQN